MNGVDRANQLRRNYTIHRPQIYRTWQPQFYWLIDTSATNGYLIMAHGNEDIEHRGHRKYQELLVTELLSTMDDGAPQVAEPIETVPQIMPRWRPLSYTKRCVWCRENGESRAPRAKRRKVLEEITNEANLGPEIYIPQTRAVCACHGVALCRKSDCWDLYHSQLVHNGPN
jgi:hypothetical protein